MTAPLQNHEPLTRSPVFRRLDGARGGAYQLNRFDEIDMLMVAVPYTIHLNISLIMGWNSLRAYATLAAFAAGVWILKSRFPDGLFPIVRSLGLGRPLSILGPDRGLGAKPYPPASQLKEGVRL